MRGSKRRLRRATVHADARFLLAERVHALRQLPYELLSVRAAMRATSEDVLGLDGDAYRRRTAIRRVLRGGIEELHILVQVHRPTLLGRLSPLAEELLVATPDGRMQREWTLPADRDDHRPFRLSR